jgi:NitT/TauT family transport system substrate-binding protein
VSETMPSRRRLLGALALAGTAGFAGMPPARAAEERLETTTLRLLRQPAICWAPQWVAEALLRAEGFADIRYVAAASTAGVNEAVSNGSVDLSMHFAPQWVSVIDNGGAVKVLTGIHVGCFELFGNAGLRTVADLKGKSVGVQALGGSDHLFTSVIAAHIGLDPAHDIRWVASRSPGPELLFEQGKIDACLGLPPVPQDLRARHIGHVLVSSSLDHPWSQYFCCMLAGNRDFVRNNPVATKRALRAILKAADLCAADPERVARYLVDRGYTPRYDYALATMRDVVYDKWRDYDAEDTMRYYALRLHELGLVKSTPQEIIANGTDWRFLDEIKQELKT